MPRPLVDGERVHVKLTHPQLKYLRAQAKRTGLTVSDLIRRALDGAISRDKKARQK